MGKKTNSPKLHGTVYSGGRYTPLDILAERVYTKGMSTPIQRRVIFVVPDPDWRAALKRLAHRQGISVSQYICNRLAVAVSQELRASKDKRNGDDN